MVEAEEEAPSRRATDVSAADGEDTRLSEGSLKSAHEARAEERQRAKNERQEAKMKEWQKQLQYTLRDGDINWDKVRKYMELGTTLGGDSGHLNPNYEDSSLVGTVHQAAFAGQVDIVQWCLATKADVNSRTSLGRAPLHYACDGNKPAAARLLLKEKADPNLGTLSMTTPLHVCCQSNTYDVALVLLHESEQVVDVDAEDTKMRIPEALAKDPNVLRAIKKYRNNLDEKRKAALQEQALKRVFELFDIRGEGSIYPEEFAETQAMIAQTSEHASDEQIEEVFKKADTNADGKIDWEEFKHGHEELLSGIGLPFRDILQSLNEIETRLFQERLKNIQNGEDLNKAAAMSPVISDQAKAIAAQRPERTIETRRKSIDVDEDEVAA